MNKHSHHFCIEIHLEISYSRENKADNMVVVLLLRIGEKKVNMIPISICYEITVWTELKCARHIAMCHSAQRRNDLWPFADIIIHYFYICLHLFWIVSNCERIIIKCIHVIVNCRRRVRAYMLIFARKQFLSMSCVCLIAYCLCMHRWEIIGFEWVSSWFLHNSQMLVFPTQRWFNCFVICLLFVLLFRNFRVRTVKNGSKTKVRWT